MTTITIECELLERAVALLEKGCTIGIHSPLLAELRAELAKPPTPAWNDAPEVAAIKAERAELLAALKACRLELYWCSRQLCSEGWDEGSTVKSALAAGLAAITKAEGRTE